MYKKIYTNIFRTESNRLKGWDYTRPSNYFVTICTNNMESFFGEIIDDKMVLSDIGDIAIECWKNIPNHFNNVVLDEYIIMPNHIHGIIQILSPHNVVETRHASSLQRMDNLQRLSSQKRLSHPQRKMGYTPLQIEMSKKSPLPKSLSVIIGSFKSAVTKIVNRKYPDQNFVWQARFYDRIIRDGESLKDIREYIQNNPKNWQNDRNNRIHLL